MKERDRRAVEAMCLCGLDLEGLYSSFPNFNREDIKSIYEMVSASPISELDGTISCNCS